MKHKFINRALALLLSLVCVMGVLPLSAFAAERSSAPGSITQKSSAYMTIGGRSVRYKAASSAINNVGLPYVFDEQVNVPGLDAPIRALLQLDWLEPPATSRGFRPSRAQATMRGATG